MINIKLDEMPNVVLQLGFKHELPEPDKRGRTVAYIRVTDIETGDVMENYEGIASLHSKDNYNKVTGRKRALANLFKTPKGMMFFNDKKERAQVWEAFKEVCKV